MTNTSLSSRNISRTERMKSAIRRRLDSRHSDAGFTLMEVTIALSVGAFALMLIFSIFSTTTSMFHNTSRATTSLGQQQVVFQKLSQSIRQAQAVKTDGYSRLVLRTADNKCELWYVHTDGKLYYKKVNNYSGYSSLSQQNVLIEGVDRVRVITSPHFSYSSSLGTVNYNLNIKGGLNTTKLSGSFSPRAAGGFIEHCWS